MEIRVLVERTLAGCATHLLETAGIREQLLVRGHRLVRATDNQQLATRLAAMKTCSGPTACW